MNKRILILLALSTTLYGSAFAMEPTSNNSNRIQDQNDVYFEQKNDIELFDLSRNNSQKPLAIIFTSSCGGGHTSVVSALKEHLKNDFELKPVFILSEVLGESDPIKQISLSNYSGENLYNFCITKKWNTFTNFMYQTARVAYSFNHTKNTQLLTDYLKKEKPSIVISVAPFINFDVLMATKDLLIPFILIPTDLDARAFTLDMPQDINFNFKFKCAIAFNEKKILDLVNIAEDKIEITGFPIRAAFFEEKNKNEIKKEFSISNEKPVIFLLMGAVGVDQIVLFVSELMKVKNPYHLIIGIGKNEGLRQKIEDLKININAHHISYSVIGFTEKISDLLGIADLFITKSGTVSFCEGLYMNIPMILDATDSILIWEEFNHTFLLENNFGKIIKHHNELPSLVDNLLENKDQLIVMKNNLQNLNKQNGSENIKKIIIGMLQQSSKN